MTATGDPRRPLRASGLLRVFADAGVLTAADVHVADRLGVLCGEADERVRLAVALAVREVRAGSVCLDLADAPRIAEAARVAAQDGATGDDDGAVTPGDGRTGLRRAGEVDLGDVVLPWPTTEAWRAVIEASPMVAVGVDGPADRPVRWARGRLYLDRYWRDEQTVRHEVRSRRATPPATVDQDALAVAVQRFIPDGPGRGDGPVVDNGRQRLAAASAVLARLTVLTGGPGTGKTTTVARLLAVLVELSGPGLRIALTAPTGKAAARLDEAVRAELARLGSEVPTGTSPPVTVGSATTLHRLLGWRPGTTTRFRHDRTHRLPHDVVVVDETSMVSLPLMARLLEALRPDARLVLVGDPDQLVSVEAGAVLGDLVAQDAGVGTLDAALSEVLPDDVARVDPDELRRGVLRLTHAHRYGARLAGLAGAVRDGAVDEVLAALRAQDDDVVTWVEVDGVVGDEVAAGVRRDVVATGRALHEAATAPDRTVLERGVAALGALERHRVLLAHRRGPAGVSTWAERAVRWIAEDVGVDLRTSWAPGLPLLVTANDRDSGLFNGDTGVVVLDDDGTPVVAFGDPASVQLVRPHRLPTAQPVHAMTIHRGQGSQFDAVTVVLPQAGSPLLTRELLYTAVTRARSRVRLIGSEEAVRAAVERPVRRASGLRLPD